MKLSPLRVCMCTGHRVCEYVHVTVCVSRASVCYGCQRDNWIWRDTQTVTEREHSHQTHLQLSTGQWDIFCFTCRRHLDTQQLIALSLSLGHFLFTLFFSLTEQFFPLTRICKARCITGLKYKSDTSSFFFFSSPLLPFRFSCLHLNLWS